MTVKLIADAAGVAEGTIFGVFPDKASLIRAALVQAFRPEPVVRVLAGLRFIEDLRDRLETIVELLSSGMAQRAPLMTAMRGFIGSPEGGELAYAMQHSRSEILTALTEAIQPDRDKLRLNPRAVARILMLMIFAGGGDVFGDTEPMSSKELVSMLLDGLLIPPTGDEPTGDNLC